MILILYREIKVNFVKQITIPPLKAKQAFDAKYPNNFQTVYDLIGQ